MGNMPARQAAGCVPMVHVVKASPDAAGPDRTPGLTASRRLADYPTWAPAPRSCRSRRLSGRRTKLGQRMDAPRFVMRVLGAGVRMPERNGFTRERGADEQERFAEWYQGRGG